MRAIISFVSIYLCLSLTSFDFSNSNRLSDEYNMLQQSQLKSFRRDLNSSYLNDKILSSSYERKREAYTVFTQDTIIFNGEDQYNYYATSVASAGDVNGDGYSDIIVGAPYNDAGAGDAGRAYIYFGGDLVDNSPDVILTCETGSSLFGVSVSNAGDVNGDGYSDVIVGANSYSVYTGRAYIFFGGVQMNNVADVILTGESVWSFFGWTVSSAGDVNGDGFSDVIVGAFRYDNVRGRAYIYLGGSSMDNFADVTLSGVSDSCKFGVSVFTAGDVDKDGYSDVIVGSEWENSLTGRAYIFKGGSTMDNIPDVTLSGELANSGFGISVCTAGDINNDGFSDVIVGAYGYGTNRGRAYIYLGGTSMNIIPGLTLTGEAPGDYFGHSVCGLGDLNDDGYDDVMVGAYGYNSNRGRAYIYLSDSLMSNAVDITFTGELPNHFFGGAVSKADDINKDGYPDIISAAQGYSAYTGRAYVYTNLVPKPSLREPANNSIFNPTSVNFKWKKLKAGETYELIVAKDSSFSEIAFHDIVAIDTTKLVEDLTRDTQYYWQVIAIDSSGRRYNSSVWNFRTIPFIKVELTVLLEGMYYPLFNQLSRKDSVMVFLRNSSYPFEKIDSAVSVIDSLSFRGVFVFKNALSATYYLSVNHFLSIETWSKSGGIFLSRDYSAHPYNFTTSASQAYGNNLKLKGGKFCIISGDITQDGYIDGSDLLIIDNDAYTFTSGRFLPSDLNGDGFTDAQDMLIADNNRSREVTKP